MKNPALLSVVPAYLGRTSAAALLLSALAACQAPESHDLGTTLVARNLEAEPNDAPFFVAPTSFAGRWIGTAEDPLALGGAAPSYHFPSGATQIVLEYTGDDSPLATVGTLTFGAGSPPPPPSDPNIGYPTDVDYADLQAYADTSAAPFPLNNHPLPPYEGFAYTVAREITNDEINLDSDPIHFGVADGVLQLSYNTAELLGPWCALQTPVAGSNGHHDCLPEGDGSAAPIDGSGRCNIMGPEDRSACPADIDELPFEEVGALLQDCVKPASVVASVDCNKAFLCSAADAAPDSAPAGECSCDATSCSLGNQNGRGHLALRLTGDELVGVFGGNALFLNERGLYEPVGIVHFRRAD